MPGMQPESYNKQEETARSTESDRENRRRSRTGTWGREEGIRMMKRLKEYLQKRKSSWPALALTAAVLLFCLVIALQAGRIGSMFHPESFLSREERKEEFDPKGYGLEEDGEKQKEDDDRREDTFEQEQTGQRTENPEAEDPAPQAYRGDNDRERTGSRQRSLPLRMRKSRTKTRMKMTRMTGRSRTKNRMSGLPEISPSPTTEIRTQCPFIKNRPLLSPISGGISR